MRRWAPPVFTIFLCSSFLISCRPAPAAPTPAVPTPLSTIEPGLPSWTPQIGSRFQIQLSDYRPALDQDVDIFELDLFEASTNAIRDLHQRDKKVICYFNAGAWEDFRPDAEAFPSQVIGKAYRGWPGEYWLDVGRYKIFAHLIQDRLDLAVAKGCDGVDPDNINGYQQPTGFEISAADQLTYNIWLSEQAHQRRLAVGLKNNSEQVGDLIDHFDFAVLEDCAVYAECALYLPFIQNGKAVFQIEYSDHFAGPQAFCAESRAHQFSALFKQRDLGAFVEYCP